MDETPVWFDMAGNFTVNLKGEKTVHIRAIGNDKNRFTVVLTCAAGMFLFIYIFSSSIMFHLLMLLYIYYCRWNKAPPICIFKGKRLTHKEQK